jgi:tetratricopeptide (TPR) repeat protein
MRIVLSISLIFVFSQVFAQRASRDYGDVYYDFFQFKEAIKYYEQALQENPQQKEKQYVYQQLSQCYKYLFKYEKAETYFQLMMTAAEQVKPEYFIDYGNILKLNGKYTEAKKQFKKYNEITQSDLASPFLRSVNWAIKHADTIKDYAIAVTDLNISGQALGYCFYDDGLIYAHARNKVKLGKSQTLLFDLDYARIGMRPVEFSEDMKLLEMIEFDLNEGSPSVSKDEKTLYFSANATKVKGGRKKTIGIIQVSEDGISNFKIYAAQQDVGYFQKPEALSFNDNNFNYIHPNISEDGNTLYFSSDMPGGFGGFDLYKVIKEYDGKWSDPINLGMVVNSEENELFPWVTNGLIFFTSKGFNGYGGYDIFVARINKLGFPTNLKNMGQPINSYRDDVAFISKDGGITGYVSSNRDNDEGIDFVYYFRELVPHEKLDANDLVVDTTLSASIVMTNPMVSVAQLKDTSAPIKQVSTKPIAQKSATTIIKNSKKQDLPIKDKMAINVDGNPPDELLNKQFTRQQMHAADSIAVLLKRYKNANVLVEAHADSRGSAEYNKRLTNKRAASVKQYLKQKGVTDSRIVTKGLGESGLLNECSDGVSCTEAQHSINRRVEMKIIK